MRLTLRTLLAYLDDILEPDDHEQIAKKIEESEFAKSLVQRTRECVRRMRLGVPALVGRGLAADPNTVAEYLDNTLPADRVGEFERICLESDVHLAEVAASHQILTLVLGESAEIPAESRQRMYQLASQVAAPPVQSDAARASVPPAAAMPVPTRRPKLEVPDYLRESRSRLWPVAALVLIAALLTFGGLMAFGPATLRQRLTAWTSDTQTSEARSAAADEQPATETQIKQPVVASSTPPSDKPAEPPAADSAAALTIAPADVAGNDAEAPTAPEPAAAADAKAASVTSDTSPAGTPAQPTPAAAPINAPPPLHAEPTEAPAKSKSADDPSVDADSPPRNGAAVEAFGRFNSKREVLLRFDPVAQDWTRLASQATLAKGDRLLSLPSFRPTITLGTDITIQADGAAMFELVGWTDQGVPVIGVEYGRLLMLSVGRASNSLQLKLDDHETQLTFVDADSTLALEVARVLSPGKDPEAAPAPLAVELYATSGVVRVRHGGMSNDLQAPAQQALVGSRADRPSDGEFPKWVSSEALSDIERRATATLEPLLQAERPVGLSLGELSTDRRREVRSLAIRGNAQLGNFGGCIEALGEKDEKSLWPTYIDELRLAVARGPQTAARVRSAFEKQRAPDAAGLFRMLWGYTADDLKQGAAEDLVEGLNHDSLDFRVLAFFNLQNITGLPSYGYHPSDQAKARSSTVRTWKDKLRQGKIVPRSATAPAKSKTPARSSEKASS